MCLLFTLTSAQNHDVLTWISLGRMIFFSSSKPYTKVKHANLQYLRFGWYMSCFLLSKWDRIAIMLLSVIAVDTDHSDCLCVGFPASHSTCFLLFSESLLVAVQRVIICIHMSVRYSQCTIIFCLFVYLCLSLYWFYNSAQNQRGSSDSVVVPILQPSSYVTVSWRVRIWITINAFYKLLHNFILLSCRNTVDNLVNNFVID